MLNKQIISNFFIALFLVWPSISQAQSGRALFAPPEGKVLLIIGEDRTSINDYVKTIKIVPGGTMIYTSVQYADGLDSAVDYGGGVHDGQYLLNKYPNSVIQIGLWMVGALDGIVMGQYDDSIDKLGAWIKKAKRPVFLRIGYEFDLPDNKYEPSAYRQAFRYIVDRFRKANVRNVAYVWHSFANLTSRPWEEWYPGDDYVDWFAVSAFGTPNIYMKKFGEMARQHHKGFMIAESTPQGFGPVHGIHSWKLWYEPYFKFIEDEKVQIVCYIDYDWERIPMFSGQGWGNARVQDNKVVKQKWIEEIQKDKYLNASPDLFKLLEK